VVALAVYVSFVSAAQADFVGSSKASFGAPVGPDPAWVFFSDDFRTVESGQPIAGSFSNRLNMADKAFNTPAEVPFAVSTLTYRNGSTLAYPSGNPNNINLFPVVFTLTFTTPAGLVENFAFQYQLQLTDNSLGPPASDDILTPVNVFSEKTFNVGGETFSLKLLGFSNDGGQTLANQFRLPEGATTSSDLYATITTEANPNVIVPLPPAVWAGFALFGLVGASKFRRHRLGNQ
jgi:hypothetical protein